MSDINLLPIEQRKKEIKEKKKKALAKAKLDIELTGPRKKKEVSVEKGKNFWLKFNQGLKGVWQKVKAFRPFKSPKHFKSSNLPSSLPPAADFVNHLDNIKTRKKKEFFHQTHPASHSKVSSHLDGKLNNQRAKIKDKDKDGQPKKKEQKLGSLGAGQFKSVREQLAGYKKLSQVQKREPSAAKLDINLVPGKIKVAMSDQRRIRIFATVVIICLLISVSVYLSINQAVNNRQAEAEKIDLETQQLKEKINDLKADSQKVGDFLSLLKEAKELISQHVFWTQAFKFLENNTLKGVYYSDMEVNSKNNSVALTANAKDYQTMAQQVLIFESLSEQVADVELSQAALKKLKSQESEEQEEIVIFNLLLKFKPEALRKK